MSAVELTPALPRPWRELVDLGFSVIPVEERGKLPLGKWKPFQQVRASHETIAQWAARSCNIGVVTGAISDLLVLDLDSEAAIAEAAQRGFSDTITASTGKGLHVYFRHPGGTIGNRAGIFPGADIRGDGGFVVAPGSVHPSGKAYAWRNPPGLFELASPPRWLLDLLAKPEPAKPAATIGSGSAYGERAIDNELAALRRASEGERNDALNRAAFNLAQLAAGGVIDEQSTKAHLRATAAAIGLESGEIEPTLESGWKAGGEHPRQPERRPDSRTAQFQNGGAWSDSFDPETGELTEHGVRLDDFHAYMPAHSYIFAPTGELWPATSVNSRIAPIPLKNRNGEPLLDKKGEVVEQKANAWLDENRAVEQMTWIPGKPQVIADRLVSEGGWRDRPGCNVFNLYRPPIELPGDAGKAEPWLEHVRRVYPDDAEHLIKWFAHRVQRPHEKTNHAIVMGGMQGIGKDTILEPVKQAIGPWNFAEVSPQHMLGRFNGFVKSVILRVSEARDLGDVDRFSFYDHMKTYTAAPPDVLRVDEKHLREYSVFNVCGVVITSNHKTDGIYLPADDRRHFVAWSSLARDAFADDYWQRLYGWFADGGLGHVAAYLRGLPLADFDPKAPPPKTPAFWDIVSANQAPEDAELADSLEMLGWPSAVTVASIVDVAPQPFAEFLTDRRNSRRIPHRLEQCGYAPVRNDAASDGLFKVRGKRCVIYSRNTLSIRDQIAAAQALIGR